MITISIILPFVLSKNTLLTDLARHAPQPCLISPGFFWFFFLQGQLWLGEYFSLHSYQIQGELNSPAPFPDWRELPFIELLLCATYFTFYYMLTTVLGLFALVFSCFLPQSVVGCSADRAALPPLAMTCHLPLSPSHYAETKTGVRPLDFPWGILPCSLLLPLHETKHHYHH